jgi:hypothetical protein
LTAEPNLYFSLFYSAEAIESTLFIYEARYRL